MKDRYKLLILAIVVIANLLIVNVSAQEPVDLAGFMPDIKTLTEKATITPEYSQYPWNRYTFDIEKGGGLIDINSIMNVLPGIFFAPLVLISKFTIFLLVSCYKLNIYEMMPEAINSIVGAIKTGIFEGFYEVVIVLAGVYGMYISYKGSKTSGIKVSISTILVFGLSTWFFLNPSLFATNINKASETISVNVLVQTTKAVGSASSQRYNINNADDTVVLLGNMFWDMAVKKPYELVQYGSVNQYDPNEFLKYEVGSDERKELADNFAKTNSFFTLAGLSGRIALAFIMLLLGLVYNACIALIALAIAYNHMAALFWICFAGVFFLAALYPKNGLGVLANWGIETFGFALKRIIIVTALSIYFGISLTIYGMAGKYGYFMVIAMNIVILAIAIAKHQKIYELLLGLFTANEAMVNKGMQKESMGSKLSRAVVTAYAGQRLMSNLKQKREQNQYKNFERKYKGKAEDVLTQRYTADKNVARSDAKKKLSERYNREKMEAQKRAKDTGKKPEYSRFVLEADKRVKAGLPLWTEAQIEANTIETDFVKQVDNRKEKGFTLYSDDQIKSTVNHMYKLKKEGNNPDRLLFTDVEGKSREDIRIDQKVKDQEIKTAKNYMNLEKTINNNKIEDNIEAYPEGHFKSKSVVKSYGRKGIRGISMLGQTVRNQVENQINTVKSAMNYGVEAPAVDTEVIENPPVDNVINLAEKINEVKEHAVHAQASEPSESSTVDIKSNPSLNTITITEETSKETRETVKTKIVADKEKNVEVKENIKETEAHTNEVKLHQEKIKSETIRSTDIEETAKDVQNKKELKITENNKHIDNKHVEENETHNQREVRNTVKESIINTINVEQSVTENRVSGKAQITGAEIMLAANMVVNKGKSKANNQNGGSTKSYKRLNIVGDDSKAAEGLKESNG